MATTPPLRITSVEEPPPTPRHGAWYDDFVPRYATRSTQKLANSRASAMLETPLKRRGVRTVTTPESRAPHYIQSSQQNLSPPLSPSGSPEQHRPNTKRVQVLSPNTPSTSAQSRYASSSDPSFAASCGKQNYLSESTTMNPGMLPTPTKTPRKKATPDLNVAARALFQESTPVQGNIIRTPQRDQKSKRYYGSSFARHNASKIDGHSGVQIFTDSRDAVPQLDVSQENPFLEQLSEQDTPSKPRGGKIVKRRKVAVKRKTDKQVKDAMKDDMGMVYVFRGKKIFKRFDDASENEESAAEAKYADAEAETGADVKTAKPLSRKSIKPTRLFQSEEQQRERDAEQEVTDIEDGRQAESLETSQEMQATPAPLRRSSRTAATFPPQIEDDVLVSEPGGSRIEKGGDVEAVEAQSSTRLRSASVFDSWKRVKNASTPAKITPRQGRKRDASILDDEAQNPVYTEA